MLRLNKQHKHDLSEIETAKTTARIHFSKTKESTEKDPDYEITLFLQNSNHQRISKKTQNTNEIQHSLKDPKKERLKECSLIKTYSGSGRNPVRADMIRRPIFAFNTKASRETSHAVDDLQERNPNSLRIEKRLWSFM